MKISYEWLGSLIDLKNDPESLGEILTNTGLEVEHLDPFESVAGGLAGLVVGHVLECSKVEGSDHLSVTKVDLGAEEAVQIICGAPNIAAGLKVVVAPVGTTIYPVNNEPFKIKKAKIRGNLSEGMICAEDEIGLGSDHAGIMILDNDAAVGSALKSYLKIETDYVFDIGLTPNRGDAVSHIGVARDVQAMTGEKIQTPKTVTEFPSTNYQYPVKVSDPELCPRYSGILLKNINIQDSPKWMQNRLKAIGIQPKNIAVDTTNYVLHEFGQPIHAFDADQLKGGIDIRTAQRGERITTLDDIERELDGGELLITDESGPIALAGVFGGAGSGISDETTSVFIESAYFEPGCIRRTAKKEGLNTDASFRYERGADPEITVEAMGRVVYLLQEYAGAEIASDVTDIYPTPIEPTEIKLDVAWLNAFCGTALSSKEVVDILRSLDNEIIDQTENELTVRVPLYRSEVTRPVDLAEEVLRIYGYNRVELPKHLKMSPSVLPKFDPLQLKQSIQRNLSSAGFVESINNSQTEASDDDPEDVVKILNPLSKDYAIMRYNMLDGLTKSLAYNANRKMSSMRTFEFGKVYAKLENGYKESEKLILGGYGTAWNKNWHNNSLEVDQFYLKSIVENLFQLAGIRTDSFDELVDIERIPKSKANKWDLKPSSFYAIIDWDKFIKKARRAKFALEDIPKFPVVKRDISVVLDQSVSFKQVKAIAQKSGGKFYKGIEVFDVYEGERLEEGKKAYAFSIYLYDSSKTMKDKQIEKILNNCIQLLESELAAYIRK